MRLELAIHPVTHLELGSETMLAGTWLTVGVEEVRRLVLEDRRLRDVELAVARPGESCRIGVVFDILQPRAKEPGTGVDFPGILGPFARAGEGTTHALAGMAVTVLDEGAVGFGSNVLDMSGPAAEITPFASMSHLVIAPHALQGLERHAYLNALRLASVKVAVYLARAAIGSERAKTAVYDLGGPDVQGREGLPRLAYIGQIHAHQRPAEVDEQILYGSNTRGMMPVLLHPNEWLDGAVVCSYWNMQVETFYHQNHPVIQALYRRHQAGEITFVGTIATVAAYAEEDRNRTCMMAANLAKWNLAADGVVLSKYGGGAPHADMAETARLCEQLGMKTVVAVTDMSGDRRVESALLFSYPEVDAIVYIGGGGTQLAVPEVSRVIWGNPEAAATYAGPQEIEARWVCGATNQQGASRIKAAIY
ncbi:MAG: glycine/sarcosine/betaine reductase component B subunit [Dehalococcoidia bacterium]